MSVYHDNPAIADATRNLSLDWLHERVVEREDCLVWKLAAAHGTDPQVRIGRERHGATVLVRRAIWELVHERPFPRNKIARCSCGTKLCVHPEHIKAVGKDQVQRGRKMPVSHRAKIAAAKRVKSRLSDEAVAFIRSTVGPLEPIAKQFGIDPTYVSHIRLGKVRKDYASPFTGLGARRG